MLFLFFSPLKKSFCYQKLYKCVGKKVFTISYLFSGFNNFSAASKNGLNYQLIFFRDAVDNFCDHLNFFDDAKAQLSPYKITFCQGKMAQIMLSFLLIDQ